MTLPIQRRRYPARRWDPFAGLPGFDDMFDQMNRMLTSAFRDVARISVNSWSPPVDIQETDDSFMIEPTCLGYDRRTSRSICRARTCGSAESTAQRSSRARTAISKEPAGRAGLTTGSRCPAR